MPEFDPHDLASRQLESYRLVNSPDPGDTAVAVVNPDGTLIGSGGGGTGNVNLIEVGGAPITLGQTTESASLPVTIASNQSAIPVSAASLPLPAGAATSANQTTEISNLSSIVTNTTGLATQATLAEIATDTDNLATIVTNTTGLATQTTLASILANQTNGTNQVLVTDVLVPKVFDTVQVTAVDGSDNPTTILYKTGGLAGTTVATLTIVYDGSGNFQSVVRT